MFCVFVYNTSLMCTVIFKPNRSKNYVNKNAVVFT